MSSSVRVALVAPDPLVREALAARLSGLTELELVSDPAGADAVLLDPDDDESALEELDAPVVALAADPAEARVLASLGAAGLVPRDADGEVLAGALIAVARGLAAVDPDFVAAAFPALIGRADDGPDPLTARELEVLQQLAGGLSNKEIAHRLAISEHTAKFHVNGILGKLGASTRTEAVVSAARRGLLVL